MTTILLVIGMIVAAEVLMYCSRRRAVRLQAERMARWNDYLSRSSKESGSE